MLKYSTMIGKAVHHIVSYRLNNMLHRDFGLVMDTMDVKILSPLTKTLIKVILNEQDNNVLDYDNSFDRLNYVLGEDIDFKFKIF